MSLLQNILTLERSTTSFPSKPTVETPCSQRYMTTNLEVELVSAGIHHTVSLVPFNLETQVLLKRPSDDKNNPHTDS